MESRSRRVGGGFPGYNGPTLPQATRSSRGRSHTATRTSRYGGRAGFFELLATVAGQILQENDAEEQEMQNSGERRNGKHKRRDSDTDKSRIPPRGALKDQERQGKAADVVSSLESLGEAIRDDEANEISSPDKKIHDDLGADSVHSVVNKEVLHKQPVEDIPCLMPEADENPATSVELAVFTALPHVGENEKQMTSSVSDNDENHVIKSDPESSTSTAIKHGEGCVKMLLDNDDSMENLPTPKAGDCANFNGIEMETRMGKAIEGQKAQALEHPNMDPMSSTITDVTKAEPSSEEVVHPHILDDGQTVMADSALTKKSAEKVSKCDKENARKSADVYDKRDEKVSDVEVNDRIKLDAKKFLKVTDVIIGNMHQTQAQADRSYLSELILGKARERPPSKDIRMTSPKRMVCNNLSKAMREPTHAKGMRARKAVKLVKRSRVSSSRLKRKHAEMDTTQDTDDEGLGKKSYYSGLSYTRQRTSRGFPIKRKKTTDVAPGSKPDLHVNTSSLMEFGFECAEGEPPAAAAKLRSAKAASVASSPTTRGCTAKLSKKSGEPHVKFTIKSFTIPELAVDLPESSTVSNLKRAVMDAAMNLLGGGLRVRVLMQGKRVSDEAATLAQVGISRAAKPDSLGFMLEPSPMPTSPNSTSEDPLLILSRAAGQSSPRYPLFASAVSQNGGDMGSRCPKSRPCKGSAGTGETPDSESLGNPVSGDNVDCKRIGVSLPAPRDDDIITAKTKSASTERTSFSPHTTRVAAAGALAAIRAQADATRRVSKNDPEPMASLSHSGSNRESVPPAARAIILHPGMNSAENVQGLALVPLRQKSHMMEVGKRRVRRPFTVVEVEALVHAVEKLGTGRWRDVKLRAFDQAKHRTYVDLKDKWKTLVHTARIAPHQRRGEPVPQELLERVTRAHSFWTAQAAKQQAELDY